MSKTYKKHKSNLHKSNRHKGKQHTKRNHRHNVKIQRIKPALFKKLNKLSPFELKNRLIEMAEHGNTSSNILNAGRGNPNFFNSFVREVFANLQLSCVKKSKSFKKDLVLYPNKNENYDEMFRDSIHFWPKRQQTFIRV